MEIGKNGPEILGVKIVFELNVNYARYKMTNVFYIMQSFLNVTMNSLNYFWTLLYNPIWLLVKGQGVSWSKFTDGVSQLLVGLIVDDCFASG